MVVAPKAVNDPVAPVMLLVAMLVAPKAVNDPVAPVMLVVTILVAPNAVKDPVAPVIPPTVKIPMDAMPAPVIPTICLSAP